MNHKRFFCGIIILTTAFFSAPLHIRAAEPYVNNNDEYSLSQLIQIFEQDRAVLNRRYSVRHSDEYFERFELFYNTWLNRLKDIDFMSLTHDEQVDFIMLQNHIRQQIYFTGRGKDHFHAVLQWLPDLDDIMKFIIDRRYGVKPDARQIAIRMNEWSNQIEGIRDLLEKSGPLMKWQAEATHYAIADIQSALQDAYTFYSGYDIEFTWWAEQPNLKLDKTLSEYSEWILTWFDAEAEQMDDSGIVGSPIGRDEIIRRLRFEMIDYAPEELIEIAEIQFSKAEGNMRQVASELGYGNDWHAALDHVKEAYVEPGLKPELIMRLYHESVDFIEDRNLITIPDLVKEVWRMQMMTPERQLINPFFTGGEVISISYPTHTMDHEAKMMSLRGNNPHFNRATVQHELIPGHHLQIFMNRRYKPYRAPFRTPFWGEGWALYWELLLWDLGFAETPEDRAGMLFWRSHRYARIIFSLNYHLGNWTPQQCIDYLVERVGHEYANAEAEVRRSFASSYDPLYQIAYMIGGMQFYSLYKDLVDSGVMTAPDFHDTILKEGSIPIRLVKAILTGEELRPENLPEWNFSEYIY
jgi:hypothetical protein